MKKERVRQIVQTITNCSIRASRDARVYTGLFLSLLSASCAPASPQEIQQALDALSTAQTQSRQVPASPGERFSWEANSAYIEASFAGLNKFWVDIFRQSGKPYRPLQLLVWSQEDEIPIDTGYGPLFRKPSAEPFYDGVNHRVVMPLTGLWLPPGADPEVATAFSLAHEYALAVSVELNVPQPANQGDVEGFRQLEWTAECLAGVSMDHLFPQGDALMGQIRGFFTAWTAVTPADVLTRVEAVHGTIDERMGWVRRVYEQGMSACNVFD